MKQNLVSLSVNIGRAYEIAVLGNHTLSIVAGDTDYKRQMEANCSLLRQFYNAQADYTSDIVVEMHNITAEELLLSYNSRCETIEDINSRIEECRKVQPIADIVLTTPMRNLLKSAIERLSLSLWQVNAILSVAKTIARLAKADSVKVEHLAEAILYQTPKQDKAQ